MSNKLTIALIETYAEYLKNPVPAFPERKDIIAATSPKDLGVLAIFDTETTGVDGDSEVIELAIVKYVYNKQTLQLLAITKTYQSFNEPSDLKKITPEITQITNITAEMVIGHKINWTEVEAFFNECDYLVAHNARFDLNQLAKYISLDSKIKVLCSYRGVDWESKGTINSTQEMVILHCCGFKFASHRAINDVEALGILIAKTNCLKEMVEYSQKKTMQIRGFVDAYCKDEKDESKKDPIKKIITKKGILEKVFKFSNIEKNKNNKPDWVYECKHLTEDECLAIEDELFDLMSELNPRGIDGIKINYLDQNI